jgi:hypothetical protein
VLYEQFRLCFKLSNEGNAANSTDESNYHKTEDSKHMQTEDYVGKKSGKVYKYHKDAHGFQR